MNQQTVNEAISGWFEPKPTFSPNRVNFNNGRFVSEQGFWTASNWQEGPFPLDYFTDESANARLLEAMPDAMLHHIVNESPVYRGRNNEWGCKPNHDGDVETLQWHSDRKTAIVLAFLKFASIAVESGEHE